MDRRRPRRPGGLSVQGHAGLPVQLPGLPPGPRGPVEEQEGTRRCSDECEAERSLRGTTKRILVCEVVERLNIAEEAVEFCFGKMC